MANYLILSCDGGGIRGLLTALVIQRLQDRSSFLDRVDLVAGTSTGGIIALGIAGGVSPESIVKLYREKGDQIFRRFQPPVDHRNWFTEHLTSLIRKTKDDPEKQGLLDMLIQSKNDLWYPRYVQDGLQSVLLDEIPEFRGNPTLEVLPPGKRVLVTTLRLGSENTPWAPVALHNFPTDRTEAPYPEVLPSQIHVVEAALCTSAAPVYFPPYKHPLLGYFVDGGLFANNPGSLALALAIRFGHQPLESIRMLAVGTGGTTHSLPIPHRKVFRLKEWNYGILAWLDPQQKHPKTPAFPLLSALMEAGSLADSQVCRQMLADSRGPGRYLRIQPALSSEIDLDDFSKDKVKLLEKAAETYFETEEGQAALDWVEAHFRR